MDFRRRCLPLVLRYQPRISNHFQKLDPHYGDQFLLDYNQLYIPQTHPRAYGKSFRAANFHYHSTHCPFRKNFTCSSAGYYRDGAQSLQKSKINRERWFPSDHRSKILTFPYGRGPKAAGSCRGQQALSRDTGRIKRVTSPLLDLLVGDRYWPSYRLSPGECSSASPATASRTAQARLRSSQVDGYLSFLLTRERWLSVTYFLNSRLLRKNARAQT